MGCMGLGMLAGWLIPFSVSSAMGKDLGRVTSVAYGCNIPLVDIGIIFQDFSLFQRLVSGPIFLGKCPPSMWSPCICQL